MFFEDEDEPVEEKLEDIVARAKQSGSTQPIAMARVIPANKLSGSQGRFYARIAKFKAQGRRFPHLQHYFWWLVHNLIAHSFLLIPCPWSFQFHDWTSKKLNAII